MGRTPERERAVARAMEAGIQDAARERLAPSRDEDLAVVLAAHLLRASARRRNAAGIPVAASWSMPELLACCSEAVAIMVRP